LVHLKMLSLTATGVTDEGLEGVKDLTQLETLYLPGRITDAGLPHVARLVSLRQLGVDGLKGLKGPGLKHLAKLRRLTNLALGATGVTDEGLAGGKDLTQLEYLGLPPAVTDAGLVHLKGLVNLRFLWLTQTRVKGPGLAHLRGLPKLEGFDFSQSALTDEA